MKGSRGYGLTVLQYTTLSVLDAEASCRMRSSHAGPYQMSPQAMSEVIEALEAKGLVKRRPHPHHRRVYPAVLTAKGRRVLEKCEHQVDEMEHEMLGGLSPSVREHMRERGRCLRSARSTPGSGSSLTSA